MWGCKQACVSAENRNSVCCCQTVCHRRKILPWLLQPSHWCPHWDKEMTAVTRSFCKIGQSIQSCHARMGCHVSLILFLSAPLSVCVQALKKDQWIKIPRAAFYFLNERVTDGHVTPEHTYSTQTSGTALPTESIMRSPRGAGKSCTCSSVLHKEVSLTVTCHCSSKLISAAETLLTSPCANGECHG